MRSESILIVGNINHFSPRITSYIRIWLEDGKKVTVISPEPSDHDIKQSFQNYPGNIFLFVSLGYTRSIVEYVQLIATIFLRCFLKHKFNQNDLNTNEFVSYPGWARNFILKLIKTLCFPDEEFEFLYKSYRTLKKINFLEYDTLVTSSPYFSSHVIGKIIKKRCKTLRWIADYRDTFATNPTYNVPGWRKFIDRIFERWIMFEVDSIVTVSDKYKKVLFESLNKNESEIIVIPSGYEKTIFDRRTIGRECTEDIIISYFGQYFDDFYPGDFAASTLNKLNNLLSKNNKRLNLRFYGCTNPIISSIFKDFLINIYSRIDRSKVQIYQRRSDINLVFSNGVSDSFGLSHLKLYEYLDAGRPILLITRGVSQEISKLQNYYNNLIVFNEQESSEIQKNKLNQLYNLVLNVVNNPHNFYIRAPIGKSSKILARKFLEKN